MRAGQIQLTIAARLFRYWNSVHSINTYLIYLFQSMFCQLLFGCPPPPHSTELNKLSIIGKIPRGKCPVGAGFIMEIKLIFKWHIAVAGWAGWFSSDGKLLAHTPIVKAKLNFYRLKLGSAVVLLWAFRPKNMPRHLMKQQATGWVCVVCLCMVSLWFLARHFGILTFRL